NLLSNALKFTPEGSVELSGAYDRERDRVCVSVTDTGIGIPKDEQEKVFEPFSQVDSSPTRPYGGAGLGPTIRRRLAGVPGGQSRTMPRNPWIRRSRAPPT